MSGQISAAELLEKVSGQADGAEVYEVRRFALPLSFRAGGLESVKVVETAGRALRVIRDGRLGFSSTTDLADDATLVRNALESAQFGDPVAFRFPSPQPAPAVQCFDAQVEQLSEDELIAMGEEIVARLSAYDPNLQVEASISKMVEEVRLLNSSGLDVATRRTVLSATVLATRAVEGDILIVNEGAAVCRRQDLADLAGRLIERLHWCEKIATVESKTMPVVFRSTGVVALLLPLLFGLDGREVLLGTSPLSEKLGQQAFDRRFTLIDDGRLDFAPRSTPYDDEGIPTAAKPLVEQGVVRQFLYDLKTAAQVGTAPTGNGFKAGPFFGGDFRRPPAVTSTSWLIPGGERRLEEVLQDLDEALLVENVIGLGEGNVNAGEFSNNVAVGFLVRRGEVVGRIKNTMIAGNSYELLKDRLIALSAQAEWVEGVLHTPAIVVDGVGVVSQ